MQNMLHGSQLQVSCLAGESDQQLLDNEANEQHDQVLKDDEVMEDYDEACHEEH